MPDRPILFSAPMIRALLAGTKTQTRRVIKLQPPAEFISATFDSSGTLTLCPAALAFSPLHKALRRLHKPGDRLWVREAWRTEARYDDLAPSKIPTTAPIYYAADPDPRDSEPGCAGRLRASMHMPRWASRLTLIVTEVRVQRLQDISEDDARAEGALPREELRRVGITPTARGGYAEIWNAIHKDTGLVPVPDCWRANPWVAAYTFTVHPQNIDALEERKALAEGEVR